MRQFIAERPLLQRVLQIITMLLVVSALLLLANTLTQAEFRRGDGIFNMLDSILALFSGNSAPEPLILPPEFWNIFTAAFWVFFAFSILYLIFSKDGRRNVSKRVRRVIGLFLLVWVPWALFPFLRGRQQEQEEETVSGEAVDLVFDDFETAQLAESLEDILLELPDSPSAQTALVVAGVLFAIGLLVLIWRWWQYHQDIKAMSEIPIDELRLRALEALHELRRGDAPLADLIRRCYREMVQTVQEQRGVYRERHITPREFEQRLLKSGFPQPPVQRLTRLFEQVRYGNSNAGEREKRQAIDSLEEIVAACEQMGQRRRLPQRAVES